MGVKNETSFEGNHGFNVRCKKETTINPERRSLTLMTIYII